MICDVVMFCAILKHVFRVTLANYQWVICFRDLLILELLIVCISLYVAD